MFFKIRMVCRSLFSWRDVSLNVHIYTETERWSTDPRYAIGLKMLEWPYNDNGAFY